ncbi:MAG: FIST N-terminal domain-containing protein [Candidatus Kapaibacterium sp.]
MNTCLIVANTEDDFIKQFNSVEFDFEPTLAIILVSVSYDIELITNTIVEKDIDTFGSTTCGLFNYNLGDNVNLYDEVIQVLFINIPKESYLLGICAIEDEIETGTEVSEKINEKESFTNVFTFFSGLNKNNENVLATLRNNLKSKDTIFGGFAADDLTFKNQYVICNSVVHNEALAYLAIDSTKYKLEGIATSGWQSIGSTKIITKSESNQIFEIDKEPALDYYINSLGIKETDMPVLGVEYPLLLEKNGKSVLRSVLGVDIEKRSLICAGSVPIGTKMKFSSSPGFEILENTIIELKKFAGGIDKPDLVFVFSCMARHSALGPMINEELEAIAALWPIPVFGFFTYGEIGNSKLLPCEFHNETITLATLTKI